MTLKVRINVTVKMFLKTVLCNMDLTMKFIFFRSDNIFLNFSWKKVVFRFVIII